MPSPCSLDLNFAPWRLSGVVYGTLLNDPASLAALGDAVNAPPYKAPPRAPVLYLKPRNTLAPNGAAVAVSADAGRMEIGASLGIVIGRSACSVAADQALDFVAGWVLVADLCVPHGSFYRPNVRLRARDGSCLLGRGVPRDALADVEALKIRVTVGDSPAHVARTAGMTRPVARLLQDVTEFMTLHAGDVLMLGVAAGAPEGRAGESFSIECDGLGRLHGCLVAETEEARA
jgi:5-oxopent-3-ene-1,2,5-tricarboxylate decarboxylase / 2-hydroxyhepta-2,4-diene-1,7-dioate isomerase